MANRIAPEQGYDVGVKRQYRRNVWRALSDGLTDKRSRQVLLMPSIEGDEIDVALAHGFAPAHLHVVDRNPAIVACLKRRYPSINTYGVEIDRAFERVMKSHGQIAVANLDLCTNASAPLQDFLWSCSLNGAWTADARVAVTVQRGREGRDELPSRMRRECGDQGESLMAVFQRFHMHDGRYPLTDFDVHRLMTLVMMLSGAPTWEKADELFDVSPIRCGTYRAGRVTMLWSAWQLRQVRDIPTEYELDLVWQEAGTARGARI